MRWRHSPRAPIPAHTKGRRHSGVERSLFAGPPVCDSLPETAEIFHAANQADDPAIEAFYVCTGPRRRLQTFIATSNLVVLRRPLESAQYTSEQFQKLMADHGVVCSMSRSGNVWDNAAMESFFSSLKTERTARKTYRTRDDARADVFDYIERFYNAKRRHSTIGYRSPMEFEMQAGLV